MSRIQSNSLRMEAGTSWTKRAVTTRVRMTMRKRMTRSLPLHPMRR